MYLIYPVLVYYEYDTRYERFFIKKAKMPDLIYRLTKYSDKCKLASHGVNVYFYSHILAYRIKIKLT